jgi:hypothetical protein
MGDFKVPRAVYDLWLLGVPRGTLENLRAEQLRLKSGYPRGRAKLHLILVRDEDGSWQRAQIQAEVSVETITQKK